MVLVLPCVPGLLHRIVEMTGADQVLQVFDTVTDPATTLSSWRHRLRTVALRRPLPSGRHRAHRGPALPRVRSAQSTDRRRVLLDGRPHPQRCGRGRRPALDHALADRHAADRARYGSHLARPVRSRRPVASSRTVRARLGDQRQPPPTRRRPRHQPLRRRAPPRRRRPSNPSTESGSCSRPSAWRPDFSCGHHGCAGAERRWRRGGAERPHRGTTTQRRRRNRGAVRAVRGSWRWPDHPPRTWSGGRNGHPGPPCCAGGWS